MTETFDMLFLARLQFGFTIAFHILFPSFTIGLASYLVVLEALWLQSGKSVYRRLYDFWLRLFALSFGMGVVSGIVLSYQIGTNWSQFAFATGNVLGPLLGYEVLIAFFLEASFLGVMLFGRDRVNRGVHFFSTLMVAIGTLMSAFWILAANSWMQTPAGYRLSDGVFYPSDWMQVIFNPSMPYRVTHMVLACFLASAMVVAAVGAFHLLRKPDNPAAKIMLQMALPFIAVVTLLQITVGHEHGINVHQHQPAKLAAMEGHWETHPRAAPLILFAWPDELNETNHWELSIPDVGSLVVTGSLDGAIRGLKSWPVDERPPVAPVFWGFRVMVGLGLLLLGIGQVGSWLLWRKQLSQQRWFLKLCMLSAPSGFLAILAGWIVAEVGRQPYVVYGLLRTAEALSPVTRNAVGLSLIVYFSVYSVVFSAGLYYLIAVARRGPDDENGPKETHLPLNSWLRNASRGSG